MKILSALVCVYVCVCVLYLYLFCDKACMPCKSMENRRGIVYPALSPSTLFLIQNLKLNMDPQAGQKKPCMSSCFHLPQFWGHRFTWIWTSMFSWVFESKFRSSFLFIIVSKPLSAIFSHLLVYKWIKFHIYLSIWCLYYILLCNFPSV